MKDAQPVAHKPNEHLILVRSKVLVGITKFVQSHGFSTEVGGILLGSWRGNNMEILDWTPPGKTDVSQYSRFIKQDDSHQQYAFKLWNDSQHTINWIGEWHTHPEDKPSPSSIDINTWTNLKVNQPKPMFFMVWGQKEFWAGIAINNAEQNNIKIKPVVPCEDNIHGIVFS